jgi:hypothetical protein
MWFYIEMQIIATLIRMSCVFFSEQEYEYILLKKKSKLCNILLCVLLKTVIGKDWEHSFTESDLKQRISK